MLLGHLRKIQLVFQLLTNGILGNWLSLPGRREQDLSGAG
jgi:hypothetical protein